MSSGEKIAAIGVTTAKTLSSPRPALDGTGCAILFTQGNTSAAASYQPPRLGLGQAARRFTITAAHTTRSPARHKAQSLCGFTAGHNGQVKSSLTLLCPRRYDGARGWLGLVSHLIHRIGEDLNPDPGPTCLPLGLHARQLKQQLKRQQQQ